VPCRVTVVGRPRALLVGLLEYSWRCSNAPKQKCVPNRNHNYTTPAFMRGHSWWSSLARQRRIRPHPALLRTPLPLRVPSTSLVVEREVGRHAPMLGGGLCLCPHLAHTIGRKGRSALAPKCTLVLTAVIVHHKPSI
jgi:hypothetical protein